MHIVGILEIVNLLRRCIARELRNNVFGPAYRRKNPCLWNIFLVYLISIIMALKPILQFYFLNLGIPFLLALPHLLLLYLLLEDFLLQNPHILSLNFCLVIIWESRNKAHLILRFIDFGPWESRLRQERLLIMVVSLKGLRVSLKLLPRICYLGPSTHLILQRTSWII